ncbi:hypothetical protein [Aeromonas sp. ASNIH2]|uniref:hypothetical protein n=1 Tax=Aeromonas sp. ASNIH2 TaxID=1636607 RepID=UPI000CDC348F|nr:hypothetical protein [Aeromonas sp. ASNIH2]AUY11174.1 hypothetical protein C3F36_17955 [Aeromonas sp. ASNIH2]
MSLLAALAKGIGAGTVDNAKVGFAEQQRQREAIQRKEEMGVEFDRRDAMLLEQIKAGKADTETRLAAAATENEKARQSEWAMMEKRLGAGLAKAAASANAAARGSAAKSMLSHLDELDKYRMEIDKIPDDQITPERRDQIHAQLDMQRYLIASNPNAQALAAEYGGLDRLQYALSLVPPPSEPAPDAPDSLRRPPEVHAPMRRPGSDGPNAQPSKAFSAEQLDGVLGKTQQQAKANLEEQRRAQLQGRSGNYMGVGYDPQNRAPVNVTAGKPLRLTSEFSLPSNDAYVPPYARYPK